MKEHIDILKSNLPHEKISGYAHKISTKKINAQNQNPSSFVKELFFQLDLRTLVFSYKFKRTDPTPQKSYGYKQVIKFTIHLTAEEAAFAVDVLKEKFIFKLILETKNYLIICKSFADIKMWRENFKIFFQRKNVRLATLIQKHVKKRSELTSNPEIPLNNHIEEGAFIENYLMDFSESFIAKKKPQFSRCKWTRKTQSCDKIYAREKTSSDFLGFPSLQRIVNHVIYYKSKILKRTNAQLMTIFTLNRLNKINPIKVLFSTFLRFIIFRKSGCLNRIFYNFIARKLTDLKKKLHLFQMNEDWGAFFPKTKQKIALLEDEKITFDLSKDLFESLSPIFFQEEKYAKSSTNIVVEGDKNFSKPNFRENSLAIGINHLKLEERKLVNVREELPLKINPVSLSSKEAPSMFGIHTEEKNDEDPNYIDVYHMRYPYTPIKEIVHEISSSINADQKVEKLPEPGMIVEELAMEPEAMPEENIRDLARQNTNRSVISLAGEPHFGNISIIAQRYNKIDAIDDWKEYINIGH